MKIKFLFSCAFDEFASGGCSRNINLQSENVSVKAKNKLMNLIWAKNRIFLCDFFFTIRLIKWIISLKKKKNTLTRLIFYISSIIIDCLVFT